MITRIRLWLAVALIAVLSAVAASVTLRLLLDWAGTLHRAHPATIWLIPLVGLLTMLWTQRRDLHVVLGHDRIAAHSARGEHPLPWEVAPTVALGAFASHAVGVSVGREGVAVQFSAAVSTWCADRLGLDTDRHIHVACFVLAATVGAVFAVPVGAALLIGEVLRPSGSPGWRLVPLGIVINCVALWLVQRLIGHQSGPAWAGTVGFDVAAKAVVIGVAIGLGVRAYRWATRMVSALRRVARVLTVAAVSMMIVWLSFRWSPALRGLSTDLLGAALDGQGSPELAVQKAVLTSLAVGAGFLGGEVTPTMVIGALGGSALDTTLGMSAPIAARLGVVASLTVLFGAPLSVAVMGAEMYGIRGLVPMLCATAGAALVRGRRGMWDWAGANEALVPMTKES